MHYKHVYQTFLHEDWGLWKYKICCSPVYFWNKCKFFENLFPRIQNVKLILLSGFRGHLIKKF